MAPRLGRSHPGHGSPGTWISYLAAGFPESTKEEAARPLNTEGHFQGILLTKTGPGPAHVQGNGLHLLYGEWQGHFAKESVGRWRLWTVQSATSSLYRREVGINVRGAILNQRGWEQVDKRRPPVLQRDNSEVHSTGSSEGSQRD